MKDSEIYQLELIEAALRSLERDGLIESFIDDDGEVRWRHTAARKKAIEKAGEILKLNRWTAYYSAKKGRIPTDQDRPPIARPALRPGAAARRRMKS